VTRAHPFWGSLPSRLPSWICGPLCGSKGKEEKREGARGAKKRKRKRGMAEEGKQRGKRALINFL